jgi:hypothetical protein
MSNPSDIRRPEKLVLPLSRASQRGEKVTMSPSIRESRKCVVMRISDSVRRSRNIPMRFSTSSLDTKVSGDSRWRFALAGR